MLAGRDLVADTLTLIDRNRQQVAGRLNRANAPKFRRGYFHYSIGALHTHTAGSGCQDGAGDHAASGVDLRVTPKKASGVYWGLH